MTYLEVADGSKIYYRVYGNHSRPPIILLHGNNVNHLFFKQQLKYYRQFFHVVMWDARDHGKSTNTQKNLTYHMQSQDLAALIDHLAFDQVSLLGFSDGGNVALLYASQYPNRIDHLVLDAPNRNHRDLKFFFRKSVKLAVLASKVIFRSRLARVLNLMIDDTTVTEQDLSKITAPTLIIAGQYDLIKQKSLVYLADHIKGAQLSIVPRATHLFPLTHPTDFCQMVLAFISNGGKINFD